jgi:hypothetical protein
MLWLSAGLCVGVGISSTFAESRAPSTYSFKVLAVSEEDAAEKASLMLGSGELKDGFATDGLIAARTPSCEESGNAYQCETRLYYR